MYIARVFLFYQEQCVIYIVKDLDMNNIFSIYEIFHYILYMDSWDITEINFLLLSVFAQNHHMFLQLNITKYLVLFQ